MRISFKKRVLMGLAAAFLITIIVGSLTACNNSDKKKEIIVSTSIPENIMEISSIGISKDDSQSYWGPMNHNVAKGEAGYYYLSNSATYILYFDEETKTSFPLCGKADCNHLDDTCNAYIGSGQHFGMTIYYYKGYIYIISTSGKLERVSADGSIRQEIADTFPGVPSSSLRLIFHDDFVYVYDRAGHRGSNVEATEIIMCISLDGKTKHNIVEYTGTNIFISSGKSYGDKLFFTIGTLGVSSDAEKKTRTIQQTSLGLYAYDYNTGETGKVLDEAIYDYTIDEKNNIIYYYVDGDGLYKLNIKTKEKSKLFEADNESVRCEVSYDGKNIYISNLSFASLSSSAGIDIAQKCWILDYNGEIVNTIIFQRTTDLYFGDESYLFALILQGEGNSTVYLDKNNIKNDIEWKKIEGWSIR